MEQRANSSSFPNSRRGLVLIMALWLIAIMSIFGLGLAKVSWSNYRFARFRVNRFLSLQAMDAVVLICKRNRMSDETAGYDTLAELADEAEYKSGNIKVVYWLIDEERKININTSSSSILKKLPGMDMDKALAIVNSRHKPYRVKEQLLLIDEIDARDYHRIKELITVHGQGRINVNTASEEILELVGVDRGVVRRIMDFRKGADDEPGTEDDGVFTSSHGIVDTLSQDGYLSLSQEQNLISLVSKNILGVKSENYNIRAEVYASDKLVDRYSIIIGRKENVNRYSVKQWLRY